MSAQDPFELRQAAVRLVDAPPLYSSEPIHYPEAAVRLIGKELKDYDREVMVVVNCKTNLHPINFSIASMGALDQAMVHPRKLMKNMFLSNANNILLIHNHPSGNLTPSQDDVMITDRMMQLCSLAGVGLLDHIIIGGGNERTYYSMREHEEIPADRNRFTKDIDMLHWPAAAVAETGSLKEYLQEKEVDKIQDDEEFMKTEFETVRDWCTEHKFNLSPEDEAEIQSRGLGSAMEDLKESWSSKPSVLEKLQEKTDETSRTSEKSKAKNKNVER